MIFALVLFAMVVAQPATASAPPVIQIVSPPHARYPVQSVVSADDYPAQLKGTGSTGIVRVMLGLDTQGRVTSCNILRSSGSSVLDASTCNLIHRRARFEPAKDQAGNPVNGYIPESVDWTSIRKSGN